jgi:hypothetical protein
MKNNLIIKIISITLLFVSSCKIEDQIEKSTIDFSFKKLSDSTLNEIISNYSIIKLETNINSKINTVKKVIIVNKKIFLLNHQENKQEIIVFSDTGDFIKKITGIDNNNFSGVIDFDIQPITNHIYLLDQKEQKVDIFDHNFKFLKRFNISFPAKEIAFGKKSGNVFLVFRTEHQKQKIENNSEIVIYDDNNKLVNKCFPFEKDIPQVQNNLRTLKNRNGLVMFLKAGTGQIYSIDTEECKESSSLVFTKPVLPVEKVYAAFYRGEVDLGKYIYNVDCFESDSILFTTFSSTEGDFIGIYSKKSGNSSLYNLLLDPKCKCGVKIDIVGSSGNNFIVQIPRTKISNILDILDNKRRKCNNEEMFKLIDKMKPGENPILLLMEFKF